MLPGKVYKPSDYLDILRRRGWLLVVPPIVTVFAALVYSSRIPDEYQSEMLIAILSQRVPDNFVQSTVTVSPEEQLEAISVRIKSRVYLERLIEELNLYPEERRAAPIEAVVALMSDSISVLPTQRALVRNDLQPTAFSVRFSYPDPKLAATVAQRIGSLFVSQNARDRGALAEATDEFLEQQLDKVRQELVAQEKRVEAFRLQYGQSLPTQLPTNLQAMQSTQMQIQSLTESIARDRDRKLVLERNYNDVQSAPTPVEPTRQDPQAVPIISATDPLERQLVAARANLAALERRLEPQHPDIGRMRRTIAQIEEKIAAEAASPRPVVPAPLTASDIERQRRLREMTAEMESIDRQIVFKETEIARLRGVTSEYQRRVDSVPGVESEWTILNRDYETMQAAYRDLLNKSESARLAIDLEQRQMGDQFRVVDNARVPETPSGPDRLRITIMGLLAGLVFGAGLGALFEIKDSSFRSEADIHNVLGLPVIAVVPHVVTAQVREKLRRKRMYVTTGAALATLCAGYVFWTLKLWESAF